MYAYAKLSHEKKYPLSHLISWNTTWLQGVQPRVIIISNQLARTIPYNIAQRVQRFADRFESWRVWTSVPKTPGVVAIRMRKNWLHFNGLRGLTQCMQGFSGLPFSKASSIATYKRLVKKVLAKSWAKVTNFSVLPTSECCLSHGGSPVVTHSFQDYMAIESKLCMERSALFRTYGTKGFRNWSCSGRLECDEV